MTLDDIFRAWAADKLNMHTSSVESVRWEHVPGWEGTDVTPGEPPYTIAVIHLHDGSVETIDCGNDLSALLRELQVIDNV